LHSYDIAFAKKIRNVEQATGVVVLRLADGQYRPMGTAFLVQEEGYFLTAHHVIHESHTEAGSLSQNGVPYLLIRSNLGSNEMFQVEDIQNDDLAEKDILLFKAKDFNLDLDPLKIAQPEDVKRPGMEVGFVGFTIIDNPTSPDYSLFSGKGTLSNVGTNFNSQRIYTVYGIATHGFSGGAVFLSSNGKVIGLVEGGGGDELGKTGIVYVPPVHDVPRIIANLKQPPQEYSS